MSQSEPLGNSLHQFARQLTGIDRITEQAFLELGNRIDSGQQRVTLLAKEAAELLDPPDGESSEQIVMRLQLLTERCALWLDEARRQSLEICAILEELQRDVGTLRNPREGLGKIVKILQSLRVATRIEAARTFGHGALVLGQELQGLSQTMQEKIGFIAERCEVLSALLQRAQLVEQQAQEGSLAAARSEIGQTRQLLSGVAGHCVRTSDQASLLHRHSVELASSFGELVAALQFQDITRQRLQHIARTLDDLGDRAELEEGVVGSLCHLQHEQLQWATEEFVAAVDRLVDNLQRMASDVQQLARETGAAVMAGGGEQCALVAPSLQAVTECLQTVQTTHLAASQALFAVTQAVRDVSLLTDEVEQLGEEMQLLAQNAAISAAHGAQHGAGLTVIADNIQKLAEDAGRHAQSLTTLCRQVSVKAGNLDELEQSYGGRDVDLETLLSEACALLERLRSTGLSLDRQVNSLGSQAQTLAGDLYQAIDDFDVRQRFVVAVEPVLAGLQALAAVSGSRPESSDPLFEELQRRYTMMSQRHIHRQVVDGGSDAANQGLGDNVELF